MRFKENIDAERRKVLDRLVESLTDTPAVLLVGPRRAGKTTLARSMNNGGRVNLTLDDHTTLEAARTDPIAFVRGLDLAIIDEVQRAPNLVLAIKKAIDDDYRPGRFLLTGSANVMTFAKRCGQPRWSYGNDRVATALAIRGARPPPGRFSMSFSQAIYRSQKTS